MKITKFETFIVPPRWLFLKVETDEGIVGWGEPIVEGRAKTVQTAVEELSEYLIGKDPFSCSFGPSIRLAELVEDPYQFDITCRIYRKNELIFEGHANTSQLKRKLDSLVEYLIRDNQIFNGTVLLTGTCIVPPDDFTLLEDDRIKIEVSGIGVLQNTVKLTQSITEKINN